MGELKRIVCRSCGSEWECRTGCGLVHGKLEWIADLYGEDIRKEIKSCLKEGQLVPFTFAYQLSCCKKCGRIESVPVLRLEEDGREYVGVCRQCGQKPELVEEIEKTPCPVCHSPALETEEIGHWD